MKIFWIIFCLIPISQKLIGQINTPDFTIFQGKNSINKEGKSYDFAINKNDEIKIVLSVEKEKDLASIVLIDKNSNETVWKKGKVSSVNETIRIPEESVYSLQLTGRGGKKDVSISITRISGKEKLYNPAWMQYNSISTENISYEVDTMIGYQDPVISYHDIRLFNKYMYQKVDVFDYNDQILGQGGIHNSQAKIKPLAINKANIPDSAIFKGYHYNVSSTIGGAKHWALADIGVSAASMVMSPAASFAAHGAMGLIGPQPGSEPIQYFMSNRESDLKVAQEIYSLYNSGREATNKAKDVIGDIAGHFSSSAEKNVKGTKVKEYNEGDMSFNEKGLVTNLSVTEALPPTAKYILFGNPDIGQAKNLKLNAYALYYKPTYNTLSAEEQYFQALIQKLSKTKIKYTKTIHLESIK
ncbi:hypothetical protein OM075_13895 [Marinilabiliaceae bacterium AAT]|uniref:Uncharacterized protein n=2 Tax=Plebeiibacterium sediminum TaxID=2992112 RepID=A0AAE3SFY0_9BACT|nr:hypothetical protein [Plebeiobacterium sediminum]